MAVKFIKKIINSKKLTKKHLVFIAAFIGIGLLVLSELLPAENDNSKAYEAGQDAIDSYEQYAIDIEKRLTELISQIDGAGKTNVMVTLECSDESIYAKSEKNKTSDDSASFEQEYIIVEADNSQKGILLKVTQPKIRGVAIVCSGGDSPAVKQSITDTVTAVLDISSARVNIAKMKNNNGG